MIHKKDILKALAIYFGKDPDANYQIIYNAYQAANIEGINLVPLFNEIENPIPDLKLLRLKLDNVTYDVQEKLDNGAKNAPELQRYLDVMIEHAYSAALQDNEHMTERSYRR